MLAGEVDEVEVLGGFEAVVVVPILLVVEVEDWFVLVEVMVELVDVVVVYEVEEVAVVDEDEVDEEL